MLSFSSTRPKEKELVNALVSQAEARAPIDFAGPAQEYLRDKFVNKTEATAKVLDTPQRTAVAASTPHIQHFRVIGAGRKEPRAMNASTVGEISAPKSTAHSDIILEIDISPIRSVEALPEDRGHTNTREKGAKSSEAGGNEIKLPTPANKPLVYERSDLARAQCAACGGTKSAIRCSVCLSTWHMNCANIPRDDFPSINRGYYKCPICESKQAVEPSNKDTKEGASSNKESWTPEELSILLKSVTLSQTGKPLMTFALSNLPGRSPREIVRRWKAIRRHQKIKSARLREAKQKEEEEGQTAAKKLIPDTEESAPKPKKPKLSVQQMEVDLEQAPSTQQSDTEVLAACEALVRLKSATGDTDSVDSSFVNVSYSSSDGSTDYGRLVALELKKAVEKKYPLDQLENSMSGQIVVRQSEEEDDDPVDLDICK